MNRTRFLNYELHFNVMTSCSMKSLPRTVANRQIQGTGDHVDQLHDCRRVSMRTKGPMTTMSVGRRSVRRVFVVNDTVVNCVNMETRESTRLTVCY